MSAHWPPCRLRSWTPLGVSDAAAQPPRQARASLNGSSTAGTGSRGVEPDELTRCAALCTGPASPRHRWTDGRANLATSAAVPATALVHVIGPPASQPCVEPWIRPIARRYLRRRDRRATRWHPPHQPASNAHRPHPLSADDALASAIESALSSGLCTRGNAASACRAPEYTRTTVGPPLSPGARRAVAGPAPGVRLGARGSSTGSSSPRRDRSREPGQGDAARAWERAVRLRDPVDPVGARGRRPPGAPHRRGPEPATIDAIGAVGAVGWARRACW